MFVYNRDYIYTYILYYMCIHYNTDIIAAVLVAGYIGQSVKLRSRHALGMKMFGPIVFVLKMRTPFQG